MASFLLLTRHKVLANSSFTCKFWLRAFQSFGSGLRQTLPASTDAISIKLPQIILPNQGNLEKDFRIELFDTDLLGVSLSHMETSNQVEGDRETRSSSMVIMNESVCSSGLAKTSLDFEEIEDLMLHKRLVYKLDKGSKEFEEYNLRLHRKKSMNKCHERASHSELRKERKELQKKQSQRVARPSKVSKYFEQEAESSHITKDEVVKSSITEGKRVRTPTFNQLTDPYHLPFCLDIYVSKGSVRACIVHRITSKVVAVAHSISKDMKFELKSWKDAIACASVGEVLAQRAIEDDIHNVVYTPRKGEGIEGKIQIVLQTIIDHGVDVKVKLKLKQKRPLKVSTLCKFKHFYVIISYPFEQDRLLITDYTL